MSDQSNSANGAMLSPQATMIETASGRFVDVANPDPATIDLGDIAQGLALTCRYGGHVSRFYSVAEHSVLVHDLLDWQGADEQILIAALFHDAPEAYLGDVVAPLKYALRDGQPESAYDLLDDAMVVALIDRFDLSLSALSAAPLRTADMWALKIEAAELTHSGGAEWRWPGTLPLAGTLPGEIEWHGGLLPDRACRAWLAQVARYGFAA